MIRDYDSAKLANGILRGGLVEGLEFPNLAGPEPVSRILHMGTVNLLGPLELEALFANLKTIHHVKKGLVRPFPLKVHQDGIVIILSLWRGETHECRVLHGNDGDDGFEKELGVNVSRLIHNANVGTRTTSRLGGKKGGKRKNKNMVRMCVCVCGW